MNKLQEEIVKKVGANSTGTGQIVEDNLEFKHSLTFSDGTTSSSYYTCEGTVVISDDDGFDIDFEGYSEEDQQLIYNAIMDKDE